MHNLRYVFPGALSGFLAMVFLEYLPWLRNGAERLAPERRWTRRDTALMLAVTAAYAVVAFLGLGDRQGVESFCRFQSRGAYALLELDGETDIGCIRYYSGLNTGIYRLEFSTDGENYVDVSTLEQSHTHVFKWNEAELDENRPCAKYLRLTAGGELYLGELAIYDGEGRLLTDRLSWPAGCDRLFDEQEKVPERMEYTNSTYFDEIYHARTAYEHIQNMYPYEITHPPLGKLILGLGIRLWGMVPFGWRFSGTLIGVLMLPAVYVFLKRMFGGRWTPFCGTLVMASDFMHFVQTRIATIDSYSVFFILLMYLFFWEYWQSGRTKRREWLPPLVLSGICFGLGAASKWTCLYAGAGLGVLWLLDRILRAVDMAREDRTREYVSETAGNVLVRKGWKREYVSETAENILWCLLIFVVIPCGIYYVSYWPYGTARGMEGPGMLFSKDYLKIVLDNQKYMFHYHKGVDATHPYSSVWWQWMLDIRPILYYLQYYPGDMHVSFGAWVNPALCWGGLLAMAAMAWRTFRHGDRTALFIFVGYLAQLLPWTLVSRVVFEYHYFPSTVFLLLAVCCVFGTVEQHKRWPLFAYAGVSVGLFALFYPALRGLPVSRAFGQSFLDWLPTWPF